MMTPSSRRTERRRMHLSLADLRLLFGVLLIGVTPLTAAALPIYETAPAGPVAPFGDLPPVIVADQSLGVRFHVSAPVTTGSIGGYFAQYTPGVESDIIGAIVRLNGPHDFPNSLDLTSGDVLGQTNVHISEPAGNFAGDLSLTLFGGWYALVFAATGGQDQNNAVMPRMDESVGDPLFFFGRTIDNGIGETGGQGSSRCAGGPGPQGLRATGKPSMAGQGSSNACGPPPWNTGFEYLDGGGLDGVRMFVDTDPASPVPEPSTLLLLGSGLAGLGGVAWRRHRRS